MSHRLLAAVFAVVALSFSCGAPDTPPPGDLVQSSKQRITQAAPDADVARTVDDATSFGFDVYRKLATAEGNLAFSPYSVTTALAMTYPGARGDTAAAFKSTLHISLPDAQFHRAMNTVDLALESRGQGAAGRDGKPFRLRSNNQLFLQQGLTLLPDFLDVLAEEYGAGVRLLDFAGAPNPSRLSINAWVNVNTEGLIPELLKQGTITSDTVLTLVNTLYFNAAWKTKFDHDKTQPGPFTRSDGSTIQVPMMAGEDIASRYAKVGDVDVVELPYQGDEVAMLVLAPPAGQLSALEASLTGATLRQYVDALGDEQARALKLPKFEARTQASLKEVLTALGLGVAFSGDADLSGLTGEAGLVISDVVHEAVVKTDEAGTEAAAATAVIVGRTSLPSYLEIDRPFVYVIRDRGTGAVLFVGRVAVPEALSN